MSEHHFDSSFLNFDFVVEISEWDCLLTIFGQQKDDLFASMIMVLKFAVVTAK